MSSSCSVCGSLQTNIVDGLMYCNTCGTQIFDYRELEADNDEVVIGRSKISRRKTADQCNMSKGEMETATLSLSTVSTRKRRKGEELESYIKCSAADDSVNSGEVLKDVTTGRTHAPSYLKKIGLRISTFTKMLAKGVAMLRKESAIPTSFPDHVFSLYQRYLSACNVAYTSKDYTEDLETMFRAIVINKTSANERAQEKMRKKEQRKEQGKKALEKSTSAWDLLLGDTLDENLEIESVGEHQEECDPENAATSRTQANSRLVQVVDTMIPKDVLIHAESFYLALDVLVAILFISLLTIGCRWIVLSDIIRWIREGRLGISVFQLAALGTNRVVESKAPDKSFWTKMNIPLYEFHRTVLFIWQICRLPTTPTKIDFEQIIVRILYNLNLPRAIMERILFIIERAPPCVELDETSLRRQGSIEHGRFANGFLVNSSSAVQMVTVFGRPKRYRNNLNTDIFFSTETKAFAYVLMALKLCFGLDGVREFHFNENADNLFNNAFNIMEWIYQLKMRIMLWEGYDPLDILQTNKPVEPLLYENDFRRGQISHFERYEKSTDDNIAYRVRYSSRDFGFNHCIPSSMRIDNSTSIPNPFPEYTCGTHNCGSDDESLYAPLRRQEKVLRTFFARTRTTDEAQELRTSTDESAVKTFKADFEKHLLIAQQSSPAACKSNSRQNETTNAISNQKWFTLFPCAKGYVRYPRPNFTNGGVLYLKEKDISVFNLNKRMGLGSMTSGLRVLFASRKGAIDAWESAQPAMSRTFAMLIHWFSKIIGESEPVLYCAFMMLEFQVVDKQKFSELRHAVISGKDYPIKVSKAESDGHRTFRTLRVSADESISKASEIDVVRIGLPKNWRVPVDQSSELYDVIEGRDYSSSCGSESDSSDTLSSSDEVTKVPEATSTCSKKHTASSGARSSTNIRQVAYFQRHSCAYEFDIIWMLITMRYW